MSFPQESIDDNSILYCRIHKTNIDASKQGKARIKPAAFDPTPYEEPDGLSVNWNKYANAQSTRDEVINRNKLPSNYGVASFVARDVRAIPLRVIHKPTRNQAHSLILDIPPRIENDARKVLKLIDIYSWEIFI